MINCARCNTRYPQSARRCPGCGVTPEVSPDGAALIAPGTERPPEPPILLQSPDPPPESDVAVFRSWATDENPGLSGPTPKSGPAAPSLTDPLIGIEPLGQYRIVQRLGEGAFGTVYLAEQPRVGRKAVIKILKPEHARSPDVLKRFHREAAAMAALDHHHLARLYNFGDLPDGQPFLAMEYGGDRTLAHEIKRLGRLPLERALRIAEQIALAIHEAHAHGVVHRDLKPGNVILGQKEGLDWAKVVDVGIAKILRESDVDDGQSDISHLGMLIGTPAYFSPEQARGLPVDGRSDVYSLGCVLYEMISGHLPIAAETPRDFIHAHRADNPIPLPRWGIAVPPGVESILARMLLKDREARPTATEAAELLAAAQTALANTVPRKLLARRGAIASAALFGAGALWWMATPHLPLSARARTGQVAASQDAGRLSGPTELSELATAIVMVPDAGVKLVDPATPEGGGVEGARAGSHPADGVAPPAPHPPPDLMAADVKRVTALVKARKFTAALTHGRAALRQYPSSPSKVKLYKQLSVAALELGDSATALEYLQQYGPLCPHADRPWFNAQMAKVKGDLGLSQP